MSENMTTKKELQKEFCRIYDEAKSTWDPEEKERLIGEYTAILRQIDTIEDDF